MSPILIVFLKKRKEKRIRQEEAKKGRGGGREGGGDKGVSQVLARCVLLPIDPRRRNNSPSGKYSAFSKGVLGSVHGIRSLVGGYGGMAAALRRRRHLDRHIFHFLAVSVRRLPARRRGEGAPRWPSQDIPQVSRSSVSSPKIQLSSGSKVSRRREGRVRVRPFLKWRRFFVLFLCAHSTQPAVLLALRFCFTEKRWFVEWRDAISKDWKVESLVFLKVWEAFLVP